MTGLPRAASATAPASLPPRGLDGLDPAWSRLVDVPVSGGAPTAPGGGETHRWHVLDTGPRLAELGVQPVGTLLCVHGNPTWSYLWRSLAAATVAAAADGGPAWRVLAVDQLEMGFSERTGTVRRLARRVQDLADLTDAVGLSGPVVTVGHDWGGVVSLGWAVDHPDALSGVVLLNTAVHQPQGKPIPAALRAALAALGPSTVRTPAFLETTLALARGGLPAPVKDAYRAPYRTPERRGGIGGFVADIPADAVHPSRPELDRVADGVRRLAVPALMLWGPEDPVFSDRYLDDLVDRLPHADVHRFEGASHLVAEDVDHAPAVLTWLADRVPEGPRGDGPTTSPVAGSPWTPLWRHLEDHAGDPSTALVEMAPPTGGGPRTVSWRLLARRVHELAAGLQQVGVRPGDRVCLLVPPGADLTALLYACLRLGAVVVVADAGLGVAGLTRAVRGAQPDVVVGVDRALAAARALRWPGRRVSVRDLSAVRARALGVDHSLPGLVALGADAPVPPEPAADDTAAILFTSGSTGPAKGVVYTHRQLAAMRDVLARHLGLGPGTGLVAGFAPFALLGPALGCRSVTPDMDVTRPRTLRATAVAAAVAAVDATAVFLSPAALTNVVATAGDLDDAGRRALAGVAVLLSAGAPVPPDLLEQAAAIVPAAVVHTPYGMTEGLLLTDVTLEEVRAAQAGPDRLAGVCVGRPVDGVVVRIAPLDADGAATGALTREPGVTGEVVVRAEHVKGHYDRLWLTDRASRCVDGTPSAERLHRTGDVGHLDADGRLWIEGRLAHVLVTADGVVTPVGPELRLATVPEVCRAALVGVGPRGTQQPVAVVETDPAARRPGLAEPWLTEELRAATGLPLAAVLLVPALPTDVRHNSKVDRTALAAWADGVLAGGRMTAP